MDQEEEFEMMTLKQIIEFSSQHFNCTVDVIRPLINQIFSEEMNEDEKALPGEVQVRCDVDKFIDTADLGIETMHTMAEQLAAKYDNHVAVVKKAIFRILEERIVLLQEKRKARELSKLIRCGKRVTKSEGRRMMWLSGELASAMGVGQSDIQTIKPVVKWVVDHIKNNNLATNVKNRAHLDDVLQSIFPKLKVKTISSTLSSIEDLLKKNSCVTWWITTAASKDAFAACEKSYRAAQLEKKSTLNEEGDEWDEHKDDEDQGKENLEISMLKEKKRKDRKVIEKAAAEEEEEETANEEEKEEKGEGERDEEVGRVVKRRRRALSLVAELKRKGRYLSDDEQEEEEKKKESDEDFEMDGDDDEEEDSLTLSEEEEESGGKSDNCERVCEQQTAKKKSSPLSPPQPAPPINQDDATKKRGRPKKSAVLSAAKAMKVETAEESRSCSVFEEGKEDVEVKSEAKTHIDTQAETDNNKKIFKISSFFSAVKRSTKASVDGVSPPVDVTSSSMEPEDPKTLLKDEKDEVSK
eukprot:GDKJ01029296.1.p1 GENE.GDKJ01029296.1~~GDKJ01029296.1.p1  ORF type:complete len:562 (+),score=195.70 GDKJ01029296.1:114-1688(+)